MASRKLVVEIVGDSRSLERAFARSSKSARKFQASIDRRNAVGSAAGFAGLGRSLSALARSPLASKRPSTPPPT